MESGLFAPQKEDDEPVPDDGYKSSESEKQEL
jgi:hypothetical protein